MNTNEWREWIEFYSDIGLNYSKSLYLFLISFLNYILKVFNVRETYEFISLNFNNKQLKTFI